MKSKPDKSSIAKSTKYSQVNDKTLIGQILVELGYITIYQLDEALFIQKQDKENNKEPKTLGQIFLELGYCGPNQLIRAIQVQAEYRKLKTNLQE